MAKEKVKPIPADEPENLSNDPNALVSPVEADASDLPRVAPVEASVPTLRRLTVHRAYCGPDTGERYILPGAYFADDPSLFGLAEFLVANQYAAWI